MVRFTTCSSRSTSELGCSTSYALPCQLESLGSRSEKLVFELLPLRAAPSGGKQKSKKGGCALFAAIGLNIPSPGNSHQGNKANFLVCMLVSLPTYPADSRHSILTPCCHVYVEVRQDT